MSEAYSDVGGHVERSWRRVHANSEQTYVYVVSTGDAGYAAIAADVDPREYKPVEAEIIAYDPTLEGAIERAERWMEQNRKGVASSSSGGVLRKLYEKLNDFGNDANATHEPY